MIGSPKNSQENNPCGKRKIKRRKYFLDAFTFFLALGVKHKNNTVSNGKYSVAAGSVAGISVACLSS